MLKKSFVNILLFSFLLVGPAFTEAQTCAIDYNKPTIAAGFHHTAGLKEDGMWWQWDIIAVAKWMFRIGPI
ncbi:MAG: hypothetical protein HZB79_02045 [Deltaproteobacteria bacterium]|nr:hypothetical protein [Deltaproteobacteria bacterium]